MPLHCLSTVSYTFVDRLGDNESVCNNYENLLKRQNPYAEAQGITKSNNLYRDLITFR